MRRPNRKLRIIDAHCSRSDGDGIVLDAQLANVIACFLSGKPFLTPGLRGDKAVHRHSHLERDVRTLRANRARKWFDDRKRLRILENLDLDAAIAQITNAAAVRFRVGVACADDDARNTGFGDCMRAGRRAAVMIAGFQRNEKRRAARVLTGCQQCVHFGVCLARTMVIAFAGDFAVPHDHSSNGGIGRSTADPAHSQFVCAFEIQPVEWVHTAVLSPGDNDRLFDARAGGA